MSAVALRHPETEDPEVSSLDPQTDLAADHWDEYSSYVDVFTGPPAEEELKRNRSKVRRNRHFRLTVPFLAGALVFAQLLGLVYFYSLDLKYTRQAAKLDENIRQTRLQISLIQSKMAASKSTPHLTQWAAQLGYRPAQLGDMDDTTSNSSFVPTKPQTSEAVR